MSLQQYFGTTTTRNSAVIIYIRLSIVEWKLIANYLLWLYVNFYVARLLEYPLKSFTNLQTLQGASGILPLFQPWFVFTVFEPILIEMAIFWHVIVC